MESKEIRVRFEGLTDAAANRAAVELRDALRQAAGSQAEIDVLKEDPEKQDFGTTLAVVLGTPAAIAICKGIAAYIAKRGDRVVIETPQGHVIASGDASTNIDVARVVEALTGG